MRRSPHPLRESDAGRSPGRLALPPLRLRTGVDLAEVARVEKLMTSQPELQERVFTPRELAYCRRRRRTGEHLAGRWAVKEAVLKCLGTGMGRGMEWTDIEVVNDRGGRPGVRLYGAVEAYARSLGMHQLEISLSHSGGLAVAHAVMVCLPDAPDPQAAEPLEPPEPDRAAHPAAPTTHPAAPTTHPAEGDDRHEA